MVEQIISVEFSKIWMSTDTNQAYYHSFRSDMIVGSS